MAAITEEMKKEVRETIFNFFAEECEVEKESLTDDMLIIENLGGDSLMFLELLEICKKKYKLNVEMKSIGKYVIKNPTTTIGELIKTTLLIIEHENNIVNL